MLHAELHGKTDQHASNGDRREDLLTSIVFGTLFTASATDVIVAWLRRARTVAGDRSATVGATNVDDYWFWPRMAEAEPDVVIRLGDLLVIVEAKYFSNKSGDSATTEADQLARQWRSCARDVETRGYPPRLGEAICACTRRVLVYLVRRRAWLRAERELADSQARMPDADMYLLTWEDLDAVLVARERGWTRDLYEFLRGRRLTAFHGFGTGLLGEVAPGLATWRGQGDSSALRWSTTFAPGALARMAMLGGVTDSSAPTARTGWAHIMTRDGLELISALAGRAPRFLEEEHQG